MGKKINKCSTKSIISLLYVLIMRPIRLDEITHKRFTFTADPDNLPIEFYEK